jgi:adenylate kinase
MYHLPGRPLNVNLLLLGPQGSGKGTQAKRISAAYGIPHIATGDMLRSAMASRTELGRKVKPIYDSGRLVPDDLMIELIRERLAQDDTENGFVLDGFPRTLPQAEALDPMLREIGKELTVVFVLQLPDEVCIERLTKRAQLEGRLDDTPEAVAKRLELYHRETEPLIEWYRIRSNVVTVHADRSPNEVFAEIQQALEQAAVA